MTTQFALISGTTNVIFEVWEYGGPYELKSKYRDSDIDGQDGGFSIGLGKSPLNFYPTGIIDELDYVNLYAMVGEEVVLSVHNLVSAFTVKIKNCTPLEGLKASASKVDDVVTTTYLQRRVQLELIRET
ncbi:MAG: hypothetical protein COA79_21015 [Planctomycetota bacterium]|nr:MAG: hypothetical protein COA79_21015 [Planctomycetota bacterium]